MLHSVSRRDRHWSIFQSQQMMKALSTSGLKQKKISIKPNENKTKGHVG